MACAIQILHWLSEGGYLPPSGRLLDIGESCVYRASEEELLWVLDRHGCTLTGDELHRTVAEYSRRSHTIGDPVIRTLFLAELLAATNVRYASLDVVSTGYAERFDLNIHSLAPAERNAFELVVNFGTTEHLINQMNAYRVVHDACKPGGHMFHRVPGTGYLHHGYFTYDVQFFEHLARANGYALKDLWYSGPQGLANVLQHGDAHPGVRDPRKPYNAVDGFQAHPVPNSEVNVLFQKVQDAPFRVGLELSTSATQDVGDFTSPFIHPVTLPARGPVLPPIRDPRKRVT